MSTDDSGSKTEKPTPKRLRDAKKKGDVAKSKDLTNLIMMAFWIGLLSLGIALISTPILTLMQTAFSFRPEDLDKQLMSLSILAFKTLFSISIIVLIPVAIIGLGANFMQTGAIFTLEKIKPNFSNLNPASGIKKIFSMDNLIESVKSILKAVVLFVLSWFIFKLFAKEIIQFFEGNHNSIFSAIWEITFYMSVSALGIFSFISIIDLSYQNFSFEKKMRMSIRDIKQEFKDSEGDPMLKGERQQRHKEWMENGATAATEDANVLLVNPTHIAVAIQYDIQKSPLPIVTAKGDNELAKRMRETAEKKNIPILRNIDLARKVFYETEELSPVPTELFDIIAEVLVWAKSVKKKLDEHPLEESVQSAPGEDLTNYLPRT